MPRMEETLTNRRKIIEEGIQEAEEFRDKAVEIEKSLNDEIEAARIKANEILRNCK
jgi:F0F1-type ATP synthase membrane subunit b/b'